MRRLIGLACALVACLCAAPVQATVYVNDDPGGLVAAYLQRYERLRDSGEPVVVNGLCASACTLMLGILPAHQISVTRTAVFGFHMAGYPAVDSVGQMLLVPSRRGSAFLMRYYPPFIRNWIRKHGGLTPTVIKMRGSQLPTVYRRVQ